MKTILICIALLLAGCSTTQPPDELTRLNLWANQTITYRDDPESIWQYPSETLALGTGDCEDYALLKASLLAPRMTLLHVVRVDGQLHAILEVKLPSGPVFLDNRHDEVLTLGAKLKEYGTSLYVDTPDNWLSKFRGIKA